MRHEFEPRMVPFDKELGADMRRVGRESVCHGTH
jgi:hypothetical protein